MNYKIKTKVSKDETTINVGNALYNIGSGTSDRFNKIYAATFEGDSSGAYYADLAERYTYNPNILTPVGTVMEVSDSGFDARICNTNLSNCVIGVVSLRPAYEMNNMLKRSVIIGLVGTLPVRVIGSVNKKDILVPAGFGCLRAAANKDEEIYKVGISFETNTVKSEKLVKCFIK